MQARCVPKVYKMYRGVVLLSTTNDQESYYSMHCIRLNPSRGGLAHCSFRLGPNRMVVLAANVRLRWIFCHMVWNWFMCQARLQVSTGNPLQLILLPEGPLYQIICIGVQYLNCENAGRQVGIQVGGYVSRYKGNRQTESRTSCATPSAPYWQ